MDTDFTLTGKLIRLEPLSPSHRDALVAAAGNDKELYRLSPVPLAEDEAERYIKTALEWRDAGTAVPFAIRRLKDGEVIGSTRFWQLEYWAWPKTHPRHGRDAPDACEIGYTWFSRSAIRSGANLETKLLMLGHAFQAWKTFRVCFHADARNERSIRALQGLGATREGVLRAHRLAVDLIPRNSVRFSILADDWPAIRDRLTYRLTHHSQAIGRTARL